MSSVTNPTTKRHKAHNFGADNDGVDRISDLPDALLCHILSFLPTKQSVLTSILSNRWRPLWTCVPVLHINRDHHFPHAEDSTFVNFVNSVLNLRSAAKVPIKYLRLSFGYNDLDCNQSRINTWVASATSNNVENIMLKLPKNLVLPPCVLSCTTLVALRINVLWHGDDISGFGLPSLRILEIKCHKSYVYDCFRVSKLLSICPSLKHFCLRAVLVANSSISEYIQQFQINLAKLRSVMLAITWRHKHQSKVKEWICYILKKLYNVKHMVVSWILMQSLDNASFNEIPIFEKLKHLQLIGRGTFPWASMTSLLQNCPQLKALAIDQVTDNFGEEPSWMHPQPVPTCVSTHLSEVKFKKYHGSESELDVVRYFLKNAKMLKTMTICTAQILNAEAKQQILTNYLLSQGALRGVNFCLI